MVDFDDSALLPLIIEEPSNTDASRPWDEAKAVVSSLPVYAEGRAALAVAWRTGRLDVLGLREAVRTFEELHDQLDVVEITEGLGREARRLAEQVGVRGYGAVHLASARLLADTVLATGESELLAAASATGLATADLASCVSGAIGRRSGEAVLELPASGGRLVSRRPRCRATWSTR